MNDGGFFSRSKKNSFLFLRKNICRQLRLPPHFLLTISLFLFAPLPLAPKNVSAQSIANVFEDENHVSQNWISALRLDEEDQKTPILCRLSGNNGQIGFWASKEGLEVTSENDNWNLPEKSGGAVTIQIQNHLTTEHIDPNKDEAAPITPVPFRGRLTADFQDTFFMLAQTPKRMGASITIERLLPILAALEQGESATLRFGTQQPENLPLEGTEDAIHNFRECAFKNHFADLRASIKEEKSPLENDMEDENDTDETRTAKQSQNPYKNPFIPKSSDNPWPQTHETKQPVIDEKDDPDSPDTPNEFSEQPKSPGAPLPLTEEEQAQIDQKRAEAVQEKERIEEEERQKQIAIEEEEEAKRQAEKREAERLEKIAAAKQAQEARRQRAAEKAKARKASLKAQAVKARKEKLAALRRAKKEPPAPPSAEALEARHIRAQSADVSDEMLKAQTFMQEIAGSAKNRKKKAAAKLAAKQLNTAKRQLQAQSNIEAIETARGSQERQNERGQEAAISLSQAESYISAQAQQAKTRKTRRASQNLAKELQAAQTFLEAQNAAQSSQPPGLTQTQKRHAKNALPFPPAARPKKARPATYQEEIKEKKLPVKPINPKKKPAKKLPFSDQQKLPE